MAEEDFKKPVLTYFNARGRAEIIRLILAYAEVDYEDKRINNTDWPALKPSTPFHQLPLFKYEDVTLCQSLAIARFLAKKYGLAGSNELEEARVDMVVDCIEDTVKNIFLIFFEANEEKKNLLLQRFENDILPRHMGLFESLLAPKEDQENFFVGDKLTWADLSFLNLKDYLSTIHSEISFVKYPTLVAYLDQLSSVTTIASWINKRPQSDF